MLKAGTNSPIQAGDQTIIDGNLIIGSAGEGIQFAAATPAPGMTTQIMTDYQEGLWTPTLVTDATNFTSVTYPSTVSGRYTKVGRMVHVQGEVSTTAVTVGAATGQVSIGGLPFAAAANTSGKINGNSSIMISEASGWSVNNPISAQVIAGGLVIKLFYRSAINGATISLPVLSVAIGVGNIVKFSGTYISA